MVIFQQSPTPAASAVRLGCPDISSAFRGRLPRAQLCTAAPKVTRSGSTPCLEKPTISQETHGKCCLVT